MRGDTGFDPAGSHANQSETREEPPARRAGNSHEGEAGMADTVDDTEPHDDAVFAEEDISKKGSEERGGVDPFVELMVILAGDDFRHLFGGSIAHEPEVLDHEDGKDRLHAVEGESLGGFVGDDVGNAAGHSGGLGGGGAVFGTQNGEMR